MAVKYDLYENPDPKRSGEKQPLHARFVPTGRLTADELCEYVARGNTFQPGEVKALLTCLTDTIATELAAGKIIELGDIGTLSLTLNCRPIMEKDEIRSASVRIKNMTLRTSKEMKRKLASIHLERNPHGWQSKNVDEDIITQRLTEYFATHPFMRSSDYCRLRECKRGKGLIELNKLVSEGKLIRDGKKSTIVYLAAKGRFGK